MLAMLLLMPWGWIGTLVCVCVCVYVCVHCHCIAGAEWVDVLVILLCLHGWI
jgi:hypothetical protein